MKYKIVFFDIDGTLTNRTDGKISNSTKNAIKKLTNNGIQVVAATGRPLSMCKELIHLGIETFITANGAHVKHKGTVIHKVPLNTEIICSVMDFASKNNHGLSFFSEDFCTNGIRSADIIRALNETLSLTDYPPLNPLITKQEIYLMCLYANEEMAKEYIIKFPNLNFRRWHPFVSNVLQEDISKSLAVKQVLDFFNLDKSEAMAFGDGENDIDMLEIAGYGVAMGDGNEELKKIADYVTKSSIENGIEHALKKIGMI